MKSYTVSNFSFPYSFPFKDVKEAKEAKETMTHDHNK